MVWLVFFLGEVEVVEVEMSEGFERRTMAGDCAADSEASPARGRARTALAGFARGAGRNFVDSARRRSLERAACKLPALPDLSSALPAMGEGRSAAPGAVGAGRGPV